VSNCFQRISAGAATYALCNNPRYFRPRTRLVGQRDCVNAKRSGGCFDDYFHFWATLESPPLRSVSAHQARFNFALKVRYWPFASITVARPNVCFGGVSGSGMPQCNASLPTHGGPLMRLIGHQIDAAICCPIPLFIKRGGTMEAINWEAITAIAEVIGVVVVVASLVYLAIQVQQNNSEIRLNTETAKVSAYHQTIEQIVVVWTDNEFAELSTKYEESPESLSAAERARLEVLWIPALFGHEIALELANKGLIDPRLWENMLANNKPLLTASLPIELLNQRPGLLSQQLYQELTKT
jgi:hypothetical protein